ncbi:MAG: hypothetical protein NTW49_03220 [Bacteroidia bacterium]|nr:hypothetical protein [Bacteroidia bacterium]
MLPFFTFSQNTIIGKWKVFCGGIAESKNTVGNCSLCDWEFLSRSTATMDTFFIIFTADTLTIIKKKGIFKTSFAYNNSLDELSFGLNEVNYVFKVHSILCKSKEARRKILVDGNGYVLLLEE